MCLRSIFSLSVILVMVTGHSVAYGQVYKSKDSQGRTVISDTPIPGTGQQAPVVPASSSKATNSGKPAESWAEKELELKKRLQEKKDSEEKGNKAKADADKMAENCERAKQQQAALESGVRLTTRNADGEREFMDDAQHQAELERAKKAVKDFCK